MNAEESEKIKGILLGFQHKKDCDHNKCVKLWDFFKENCSTIDENDFCKLIQHNYYQCRKDYSECRKTRYSKYF